MSLKMHRLPIKRQITPVSPSKTGVKYRKDCYQARRGILAAKWTKIRSLELTMPDVSRSPYLRPGYANYVPLSPISFLQRSADTFPDKIAVKDGATVLTYRSLQQRCHALASALLHQGLQPGQTVAVMMRNTHYLLEAHFGVPLAGGVLNAINTRLDSRAVTYILDHSDAPFMLVDDASLDIACEAAAMADHPIRIVTANVTNRPDGSADYEECLSSAPNDTRPGLPADEWLPISLSYTSGTTGKPKGVLCHHRGAYINSLGNVMAARIDDQTNYLWTLPMFHCNGWSHTWGVTAVGGTHICLPRIDPARIMELIESERITHMCAAPVVMKMMLEWAEAHDYRLTSPVRILTGGAPPASRTIIEMESIGFDVIQIFGQTETTGPSLIWEKPSNFAALSVLDRAKLKTRQGHRQVAIEAAIVANPDTLQELPRDGSSMGELLLRGNTVMMGYLDDPEETEKAMRGGWFHTGDLAVRHPDGSFEIKDRAKDIIISGGENISCLEIEEVLQQHQAVQHVAVVARPDEKWGEHPCAFIELKSTRSEVTETELVEFCRRHLASFKVPRSFVFGDLPKTETGKIQKYILRKELRRTGSQHERETR
ncbi:AMP-binding protein [Defluviimonas sp. SAOS-178_SWC]|uniref:AMP-binding protein n=1 Tax=Defluviimonas sp. SAOS-178_SWC TaxID=3121287 RepID=UPI0032217CA2